MAHNLLLLAAESKSIPNHQCTARSAHQNKATEPASKGDEAPNRRYSCQAPADLAPTPGLSRAISLAFFLSGGQGWGLAAAPFERRRSISAAVINAGLIRARVRLNRGRECAIGRVIARRPVPASAGRPIGAGAAMEKQ